MHRDVGGRRANPVILDIDECIQGTLRLTRSSFEGPVNIGSDEMVSINKLASLMMEVANKSLRIITFLVPLASEGETRTMS